MTEDELVELAGLRERAYGPEADIAGDPQAQARLAELEAAARASRPAPVFGTPPAAVRPPRTPSPARPMTVPPAPDPPASNSGASGKPTTEPADAAREARPAVREARPAARRRRTLVAGAAGIAAVVIVLAVALWPRPAAQPAAVATPSPRATAVDVACGVGWGPQAVGALNPPEPADVVWSPQWNVPAPAGPATTLMTERGQWLGELAPVFVPGGVASVVQVVEPSVARIVTFGASESNGDSFTTSDYTDVDAMVATARRIVPLPACSDPDTYPLLIIAPDRACVHLRVTLAEGPVYEATLAIGSDACSGEQ